MSQGYDIVIAGAGMVGACCALAMARQGFRVAVIEALATSPEAIEDDSDYDLRVSAISPASRQLLSRLGIWQALNQNRVCYYEQMHVWHQHGSARLEFDCAELAKSSLGAIVENRQIIHALHKACEQEPGIDWFRPDHIEKIIENSPDCLRVALSSGVDLEGDLLIAADGRGSPTRALAGLEITSGDYRQHAIVANVETELPHRHTAWQRFLDSGPLAFLPLANGQSSIVWSCDNALADELSPASDLEFCERLGAAFEYTLGKVLSMGNRQEIPLGWHFCEQWLKQRVLVIGDAAHGVHPLAGQGVNLGFSDVTLLCDLIGPLDTAWHWRSLRRFERQRKSESLLAMQAFSGLKWIYGVDSWPMNRLRDLGMRLLQSSPTCRRSLMQRAMRNMA